MGPGGRRLIGIELIVFCRAKSRGAVGVAAATQPHCPVDWNPLVFLVRLVVDFLRGRSAEPANRTLAVARCHSALRAARSPCPDRPVGTG